MCSQAVDGADGLQIRRVAVDILSKHLWKGRAIAQAISRWLPTVAARVRARVWSCGICGGHSGARGRFSPSTSVSPANLHSTNYFTITLIYHPGLIQ
jgi:ribosomal protein L37AE/L43A